MIAGGIITGNYFSGEGYNTGAHADAIWVTNSTEPPAITNNLFDETLNAGETGYSNSDIRLTGELGNLSNVTVSGNYLFGAGFTFETEVANYTISNVSVTNNVTGFATYSQYYPGTENTATVSGNTTVDFSDPTDSTNALATYVAAGVPTANVFLWNLWRSGRHRAGADDAVGQRLCVGAPRHVGLRRNEFCRRLRRTTSVRRSGC